MPSVSEQLAVAAEQHQAGRLQEAETLYREALRLDPRHPQGLHLLGVACHQLGKNEEAVECLTRAIPLATPTAELYNNRAAARLAIGRIEPAIADCRRALKINPNYLPALSNLAHGLNEQGDCKAAEIHCRRALRIAPDSAVMFLNLGRALKGLHRTDEALDAYRRSLQLDPNCAEAHNNLGNLLREEVRLDEAMAALHEALRIRPDYADAHNNLGLVLTRKQDFDDAVACYERAIAIKPSYVEAHCNLGEALARQDRLDEAASSFRRSLELKPDHVPAFAGLAKFYEGLNNLEEAMRYATEGLAISPNNPRLQLVMATCEGREGRFDEAIRLAQRVLAESEDYSADRTAADALFLLGRFHDRCGRSAEAYACYARANRLSAEEAAKLGFNKTTVAQEIAAAHQVFQPDLIKNWTPAPPWEPNDTPVFMVGFPRSGTTLLDQILDSHPKIQTLEEKPTIASVKDGLAGHHSADSWVIASMLPEHFARLREIYFRTVDRYLQRRAGCLLVDRSPLVTKDVGMMLRIFPATRFILAVRHPCDVCLSCFMQNFQIHAGTVNFFTLEETAAFYAKVMDLWQHYLRVLPVRHQVVRYEDLVDDVEGQARQLLRFLELDWDDAVLDHTRHARQRGAIRTASYHQVVQPIYRRSRYRWKRYADQLAPVLEILRPYIEYFGYATEDDAE